MSIGIIALAVPVFLMAIGIELLFSLRKKVPTYRFRDTLSNLLVGMGSEIVGVLVALISLSAYHFFSQRFSLHLITNPTVLWIAALIGVDFLYYWFHRHSHEINFLWSFHVVHHQSREYNLSVALRQSWFGGIFGWIYYLPLAIIGIPFEIFAAAKSLNLLYQFFIHTRLIGKIRFLEKIFNTPSHHRVHHGADFDYLDRNYAGALIIWDRMFGTFVEEGAEPRYGIVKPFTSYNPLTANVQPLIDLGSSMRKQSDWRHRFMILLKPPGWLPGYDRILLQERTREAVVRMPSISLTPYHSNKFMALFVMLLVTVVSVGFMVWGSTWSLGMTFVLVTVMIGVVERIGRDLGQETYGDI